MVTWFWDSCSLYILSLWTLHVHGHIRYEHYMFMAIFVMNITCSWPYSLWTLHVHGHIRYEHYMFMAIFVYLATQHKYAFYFYLTHRYDPIRCYHSGPEWTWERRQWRGTHHSPKLQYYWNLTIKLFSVISRTLVGGGSYPSAEMQSVYSTALAD